MGKQGMVSSAHPLATQAGLEVLESGGNAFDATVAVAATLNVSIRTVEEDWTHARAWLRREISGQS